MPASSIRNAASRCAVRRVAVPASRPCSLPSSAAGRAPTSCRGLASTSRRNAITNFDMPAMSPTMTEGGIANWKVKEGQPFGAGDVLLEIVRMQETDKATMDVEAQEDGVLGKIIVPNGTKDVKVGRTIALLAEEGDDISNLEAPAEEPSESPKSSAPKQDSEKSSEAGVSLQQSDLKDQEKASTASSKNLGAGSPHPASSNSHASESHAPMFPSVSRLLAENDIKDSSVIKGTGVRGMITKGDVLAYLGKTSNPNGSFKPFTGGVSTLGPAAGSKGSGAGDKKVDTKPLTGEQFRSLIMGGLADASASARAKKAAAASASSTSQEEPTLSTKKGSTNAGFDQLLASYSFTGSAKKPSSAGGKKDPLAGLL